MSATNNTREQQLRAVSAVMRAIPDPVEQQTVLDALFAEPRVIAPRGFKGPKAPDPSLYQPCGTSARYQYHRRHGEPVDDACRKANSRAEIERRNRRMAKATAKGVAA